MVNDKPFAEVLKAFQNRENGLDFTKQAFHLGASKVIENRDVVLVLEEDFRFDQLIPYRLKVRYFAGITDLRVY